MATGRGKSVYTPKKKETEDKQRLSQTIWPSPNTEGQIYKSNKTFGPDESEKLMTMFDPELNTYNTNEQCRCKILKYDGPPCRVIVQSQNDSDLKKVVVEIQTLLSDVNEFTLKISNETELGKINSLIKEKSIKSKQETDAKGEVVVRIFTKTKADNDRLMREVEKITGRKCLNSKKVCEQHLTEEAAMKNSKSKTSKSVSDDKPKTENKDVLITKSLRTDTQKQKKEGQEQQILSQFGPMGPNLGGKRQDNSVSSEVNHVKMDNSKSMRQNNESPGHSTGSTTQTTYKTPIKDKSSSKTNVNNSNIILEIFLINGFKLKLIQGSITDLHVDAIVNAANEVLVNSGGVAEVISHEAGATFEKECEEVIRREKRIKPTENVVTGAGDLKCSHVIHAVGPQWHDYQNKAKCLESVCQTVLGILHTATKRGFNSVAMPPISSGIFGVPKQLCADMYIKAVMEYDKQFYPRTRMPKELIIVDIHDEILRYIKDNYEKIGTYQKDINTKRILELYLAKYPCSTGPQTHSDKRGAVTAVDGKFVDQHKGSFHKSLPKTIDPHGREGAHQPADVQHTFPQVKCLMIHDEHFVVGDNLKVKIYTDDIVSLHGIAVLVSSENRLVNGEGPLANQIRRKAGQEYRNVHRLLIPSGQKTFFGNILYTTAGDLSYHYVFHAVTERYHEHQISAQQLGHSQNLVTNLLHKVEDVPTRKKKIRTIAMPLLGAGGVSNRDCLTRLCESVFDAIQTYVSRGSVTLEEIHLVNMSDKITETFKQVFISRSLGTAAKFTPRPLPPTPRDPRAGDPPNIHHNMQICYEWRMPSKQNPQNIEEFIWPVKAGKEKRHDDSPCVVCLDIMDNPVQLVQCKHQFCKECISQYLSRKLACPVCNFTYGTIYGNQPKNGKAEIYRDRISLPGFSRSSTWVIKYIFFDGIQTESHPNPGTPYRGTERVAYLPDTKEGKSVLLMLEKAFKQGLIFTVGSSRTTGRNNVVTWNDIHHKTNREGGPERFGYPDDDYLSRVTEELEAKGIKPE